MSSDLGRQTIRLLVEHNANLDKTVDNNPPAFHLLASLFPEDVKLFQMFLDFGADPQVIYEGKSVLQILLLSQGILNQTKIKEDKKRSSISYYANLIAQIIRGFTKNESKTFPYTPFDKFCKKDDDEIKLKLFRLPKSEHEHEHESRSPKPEQRKPFSCEKLDLLQKEQRYRYLNLLAACRAEKKIPSNTQLSEHSQNQKEITPNIQEKKTSLEEDILPFNLESLQGLLPPHILSSIQKSVPLFTEIVKQVKEIVNEGKKATIPQKEGEKCVESEASSSVENINVSKSNVQQQQE